MDCSLPGSSVYGILQARILEWVAMPSSRGSSPPRNRTLIIRSPAPAGGFFPTRSTYMRIRDQISRSVMSDSLRPHESQHARPPYPSPTPGVHSDSRPSSQWCHPAISSSVVPFSSCPQSLPAAESFPMSQLFACAYLCEKKSQNFVGWKLRHPPLPSLQTLKLWRIIVKSLSIHERERKTRSWMIQGGRESY